MAASWIRCYNCTYPDKNRIWSDTLAEAQRERALYPGLRGRDQPRCIKCGYAWPFQLAALRLADQDRRG